MINPSLPTLSLLSEPASAEERMPVETPTTGGEASPPALNAFRATAIHRERHKRIPTVMVRQIVEPLHGSSKPRLVTCSNGNMYVLKTPDNPQGCRVLANELLAHHLGTILGLPLVPCAIVYVDWLTTEILRDESDEIHRSRQPAVLGASFGSKYLSPFVVPAPATARVNNRLQKSVIACIENKRDFQGALVFDIWTMNVDRRQMICHWKVHGRLHAYLIDNGYCFCRGRWQLPDLRPDFMFEDASVYRDVTSIEDFEPWLRILEQEIDQTLLAEIAATVPVEWCDGKEGNLFTLVEQLDRRRVLVRSILETEYLDSGRFKSHNT